jgi:hypothetical protein
MWQLPGWICLWKDPTWTGDLASIPLSACHNPNTFLYSLLYKCVLLTKAMLDETEPRGKM